MCKQIKTTLRTWFPAAVLLVLMLLLPCTIQAGRIVTIGIVMDGPLAHTSWSAELFMNELQVLAADDFDIRFPVAKQLDGAWAAERISSALKQLQNDPEVDMVLALGRVSSSLAALGTRLRKPTFAPFIMDAEFQGLPREGNTSGVRNLNYLTSTANFERDLSIFQSVADFKTVAVLVDEANYHAQPGLITRARDVAAEGGVEIRFVLQQTQNENLAAKLPADAEAVVVADLARLDEPALERLITALIEKRLPSYSLLDSRLVEQGLLMAEAPVSDWRRLARRNALNMHAVLHGEPAANQPVTFKGKRRLTINMATARAIGVYPDFDIQSVAILLNEEPEQEGRTLSLLTVALEAVRANLDLRVSALGLEAGKTQVDEARASLLPQLNAGIRYTQLNEDGAQVISGAAADQSTTAAVTLTQLLYSDEMLANVEIQRYLQNNREALNRQLELDIIQEATLAFLTVLKAQNFVRIRRENMQLTRTNLELSRDRLDIGVASPSEVYRWESELATSRQELLAAQTQLKQARDTLNRLLHRSLGEPFIAIPTSLDDPALVVSRPELFDYVANDRAFELMGEFLEKEGLAASPELAGLMALIAASQRELKANQRAYWSPTVQLLGEVSNVLQENRVAGLPADGETDWQVGINVTLPLFEGGARRARVFGSRLELDQRYAQHDATRERIVQAIRSSLHGIEASYPSIQLSRDGAAAAHRNLELVTDAYTRGTVSILDLLDAQNAALVAEETATNAVFDFLIDLMNLQRSLGRFDFFLGTGEVDDWLDKLRLYIATEGQG